VAYNIEQVSTYFNKISAKWGLPIVIQEFIYGTEYNVTGLGDGEGNTIAAVPMRKQYITEKGKAWGGISISDKKILALTDKFVSQTKWRGGFELELMKNRDNEFYFLEINPRMPAWIYLAVGVGQNIPEALVNLAMGDKVKPFDSYAVGKMFIRYAWDMIVDISEFQTISSTGEL
jgi:carbamoyl-phosphate synthase large subunit